MKLQMLARMWRRLSYQMEHRELTSAFEVGSVELEEQEEQRWDVTGSECWCGLGLRAWGLGPGQSAYDGCH